MAPRTLAPKLVQGASPEPLYDIHPLTGISIEVFYSDRRLETFGRVGRGWFWWPRKRGCSPEGLPAGPFASRYAAFGHATGLQNTFGQFRTPDASTLLPRTIVLEATPRQLAKNLKHIK
jgi:hypothetical protein